MKNSFIGTLGFVLLELYTAVGIAAPRPTGTLIPHRAFVKLSPETQVEYATGVRQILQTIWTQKMIPDTILTAPARKTSRFDWIFPAHAIAQMGGKRTTCEDIEPRFRALYPQFCLPAADTKEVCPPKARKCNPFYGYVATDGGFLCVEFASADVIRGEALKQKCENAAEQNKTKLATATAKYFREHRQDYEEVSREIAEVCEKSDTVKCNSLRDDLRALDAIRERGAAVINPGTPVENSNSEGTR